MKELDTHRPAERAAERAAALLRQSYDGGLPPDRDQAELGRLQRALVGRPARRTHLVVAFALAGVSAAALMVVVRRPTLLPPQAVASAESLLFSDGSQMQLEPGGHAAVTDTGLRGAQVRLDAGHMKVAVVPRFLGRWRVKAGPYQMRVAGARFDLTWRPDTQRLVLESLEGVVEVEGPGVDGILGLEPGRTLELERGARPVPVSAPSPAVPSEAPPVVSAPAAPSPTPRRATPATPAPRVHPPVAPPVPWAERVARGQFAQVLDEARTRGLPSVLARAPAADLSALADAGRYAGDAKVAEQALRAERRRFPGTPRSAMAAFLLGRMLEERGQKDEALALYDRYLVEAPRGSLAAEALGRTLVVLHGRSDRRAATVARTYLDRFPSGSYVDVARAILKTP